MNLRGCSQSTMMTRPTVAFFLVFLANLVVRNDAVSSMQNINPGKKRNEMPENPIAKNRFLCPNCKKGKELRELETLSELDERESLPPNKGVLENAKRNEKGSMHCMKGDRGEKGESGQGGTISEEQIAAIIKPLEAKLEALKSSYTTEIARLRNEMQHLKSNVFHTLGSKFNPAMSCKDILTNDRYSPSGTYYLNVTGVTEGAIPTYCSMTEHFGCPAGSTLAMKIDGSKNTFRYSSPLWSNKAGYNAHDGTTLYDSKETKLPTYWSTPLTKVCIAMRVDSWDMEALIIDHKAGSLFDILADGKYRPTKGSRKVWQSILPGSVITDGPCLRQGFNAHGTTQESAAARIGAIAGDQPDCESFDSFIGLGTKGGSCGADRHSSCGNEPGCQGDKRIQAFGYVFVY